MLAVAPGGYLDPTAVAIHRPVTAALAVLCLPVSTDTLLCYMLKPFVDDRRHPPAPLLAQQVS